METQEALAAGQSGSAPQPQTPAQEPLNDDALRRRAVERLHEQLDIGNGLAAICEHLAGLPNPGRVEAVFAAARLMQANAQLGKSIGQLLQVEQRHRSVIKHIQPYVPVSNDSNSSQDMMMIDALTSKMLRYMIARSDVLDPAIEEAALREKEKAGPTGASD